MNNLLTNNRKTDFSSCKIYVPKNNCYSNRYLFFLIINLERVYVGICVLGWTCVKIVRVTFRIPYSRRIAYAISTTHFVYGTEVVNFRILRSLLLCGNFMRKEKSNSGTSVFMMTIFWKIVNYLISFSVILTIFLFDSLNS